MKIKHVIPSYKIAIGEFPFNKNDLKSNFQVDIAVTYSANEYRGFSLLTRKFSSYSSRQTSPAYCSI